MLGRLTSADELTYIPLVFGFVTYARADRVPSPVPLSRSAVSRRRAGRRDPRRRGARRLGDKRLSRRGRGIRRVRERRRGPAHARRWLRRAAGQPHSLGRPELDRAAAGFFSGTRATIENAWVRPRERWWPPFQLEGGRLLNEGLPHPQARTRSSIISTPSTVIASGGTREDHGRHLPRSARPGFEREATSSNQDTIIVEVTHDEGITGYRRDRPQRLGRPGVHRGAGDAHDGPRASRETLIGLDPLDPAAVWDELYVGTAMTGRRGALVHALGRARHGVVGLRGKAAGHANVAGSSARRRTSTSRRTRRCCPEADGTRDDFVGDARRPGHLGEQARFPGGEARDPDARAVRPRGPRCARRRSWSRRIAAVRRGRRAGLRDHGRRRLRVEDARTRLSR